MIRKILVAVAIVAAAFAYTGQTTQAKDFMGTAGNVGGTVVSGGIGMVSSFMGAVGTSATKPAPASTAPAKKKPKPKPTP